MGFFKQQCIDEEHKFGDRVADKIHEFDTCEDAYKWAIRENPCPWMEDDAVDHLVCEVWNEYQAEMNHGEGDLDTIWDAYGDSLAYE